ncbi:MAG: GNAT family N-acetyltransferase [Balneola sp.]
MKIRQANTEDLTMIRLLNESEVPHVNSIGEGDFIHFLDIASKFLVLEYGNEIAGFIITIREGKKYDSLNYQFFVNHYEKFEYVDRVVIKKEFQGKGFGKRLYEYLFETTETDIITCEVNILPENPGSMAFHKKMGFQDKGKLITSGGEKKVSLLVRKFI